MFSKATKFESLLEAVPDALVGMDTSGVIRFVNHQCELLFGYERDDLVGRHVETLVPQSLWQVYLAHRDDYFADPRSRAMGLDLELAGRHLDGTEFPVLVTLSHIDTGDVLLEFAAVSDMTRKEAGVREGPADDGDRGELRRCDHRQDTWGHCLELEPRRREDVRLLKPGDHRQVDRSALTAR